MSASADADHGRATGSSLEDGSETALTAELTRRRFIARTGGIVATGGLTSMLLAACGGTSGTATGGASTSGGGAALRKIQVATAGAWQGFDPTNSSYISNGPSMEILMATCDTLTAVELPPGFAAAKAAAAAGKLNGTPLLAESWDIAKGGATYRFHLRQNAGSQFGNMFSSQDVIWSISRPLADRTSVGAFLLGLAGVTSPRQLVAIDDHTIEFRLPARPPAYFLQILGLVWLPMIDSTEAKRHATGSDPWARAWLGTHTAGFGRYGLQSAVQNKSATLTPNARYWGQKAPFSTIDQEGVDDQGTRLQLLLTNTAQYTQELTPLQLAQADKGSTTTVTRFTSTRVAFLVLNTTVKPFDDPAVRRAIAQAIPYDDIIATVYRGYAQRWRSSFIPWFQGATERYWTTDTDAAAAARGLASVKGTSITLNYVKGFGSGEAIAVLIQQALNRAGLNVQLSGLLRAVADRQKVTGSLPFFIDDSDSPAVPNPLYQLNYLFATRAFQNMARYSNPQIDALTTKLAATTQIAAQNAIVDQCEQILARDLPYIPLAYTGTDGAHLKTLGDVGGDEVGLVAYKRLAPTS